jgi:SAM-dependent methyltransferase
VRYVRPVDEAVYDEIYALEDEHWWFRGRRAVIWALLDRARITRPARVLDAGCGTGRNLVEFAGLGEVTGIEPSASAVEFCHRRGLENVREARLEELPFADRSFDVLFAFDVLEHIDDDVEAMTSLRRVAADDARFVATVPAYSWLWSPHDDSHHHRRRYVRPQLLANARAAGWRPVFATYFNSLLLPPIAAVRAVRRGTGGNPETSDYALSGPLNRVLDRPMRLEAKAIRRGVKLPAGVSIGMVCVPA